uniref:Uncharacterized protein n=1 Tax=Picea sitchensis TaxID=3332 RepID=A0A6B9XWM5_PICSI|nr:hypothetical protein Q903MT_gene5798 [Picea sitchensis]
MLIGMNSDACLGFRSDFDGVNGRVNIVLKYASVLPFLQVEITVMLISRCTLRSR